MNEHAVHMALRAQAIAALPAIREWENDEITPTTGVEYVEEEFHPMGGTLRGARVGGLVVEDGVYVIRWWGLARIGTAALAASLRTLLDRFPPASKLTASDASVVFIGSSRGNVIPWRTEITNPSAYPGRAVSTVRIPFWTQSVNPT
jgi:hypothetical protein